MSRATGYKGGMPVESFPFGQEKAKKVVARVQE